MYKGISVLITGDFCPINRVGDLIESGEHEPVLQDLIPFLKRSDLAITNLECPLTDMKVNISKTGPALKASPKAANALSEAGFNLVTLANNHIMDYGAEGLRSTLASCEKNGIGWVGAGENYTEARRIYYFAIGGRKVAVLNFTENEFSTTSGNFPGANPLNPVNNYSDIKTAKRESDYVIVIVHAGNEDYQLPSPRIKETFHFYAEAGASVILSHHTHCFSGYEIYNGVPVFYGLGNFIFDYPGIREGDWNYGLAIELVLNDMITFNIIPFEQCNKQVGLKILEGEKEEYVSAKITRLNSVISDDDMLSAEFDKYCESVKKMYFSYIEPHSIMILHHMRNRKLFPPLLSKRKKRLLLNLIRCESHRDVLIRLLGKY
jgi:hypothetical protein